MQKKKLGNLIKFLETIPLFSGQHKNALERFSLNLKKLEIHHHDVLYRQGAIVENIYIVKKGQFEQ